MRSTAEGPASAAAVNREEIEHACEVLGADLWTEHVPPCWRRCRRLRGSWGWMGW